MLSDRGWGSFMNIFIRQVTGIFLMRFNVMKRAAVLHFHQLRTGHVLLALLLLWSTPTLATTVDWRTEAADGNWDGGTGCGEVGSGTSYWWYGAWTPNQARGRPDCFGNHRLCLETTTTRR